MLKKLQRKIVFMNMLLVGIVLLAVLSVFCYNEARLERSIIQGNLGRTVSFIQQEPFREFRNFFPEDDDDTFELFSGYDTDDGGRPAQDDRGMPPQGGMRDAQTISENIPSGVFAIVVDSSGDYSETYANGISLSESDQADAVTYATAHRSTELAEDTEHGLFYITVEKDGMLCLAFTDTAGYQEEVRSTILKSAVLWLVIMALFLLISMIMAKIAVRPVKESWDRQQEFVADASHELKTPLTVILANNNILLSPERHLEEDDRKWVESNQEEATHMKALVDQLLFLARSDSGDQKMLLTGLDLGDMVMGDVLQFEPVAFERGIMIDTDLEPDVRIEGDSTMIKQLIHILLDNACKYASENGTIRVSLKKEKQGCTLAVNNPGRPIPAEDLPHIFERFYRADKARTYQEGASGYGLGLAIAQSIAQDHKGSIS